MSNRCSSVILPTVNAPLNEGIIEPQTSAEAGTPFTIRFKRVRYIDVIPLRVSHFRAIHMSLADLDCSTIYDDGWAIVSYCSHHTSWQILVTSRYRYIAIVMLGLGSKYFQVLVRSLGYINRTMVTYHPTYTERISCFDRQSGIEWRVRTVSMESAIKSRLGSLLRKAINGHSQTLSCTTRSLTNSASLSLVSALNKNTMTTQLPTVGAHTYSIATRVAGQSARTDETSPFPRHSRT